MRKCPVCNSCFTRVYIENNLYLYCDFCKKFYTPKGEPVEREVINETDKSPETRQENPEA